MSTVAEFEAYSPPIQSGTIRDSGGMVYNVLSPTFGAVGDGETDDTAAIQSCIVMASSASVFGAVTVLCPYTNDGYSVTGLIMKSNVQLQGEAGVLLSLSSITGVLLNHTGVSNTCVSGFTFNPNGNATAAAVRISSNCDHNIITRNTFYDTGQRVGVFAIDTQVNVTYLSITWNSFVNLPNNIRLNDGPAHVEVAHNVFTGWTERCLYMLGSATYSCSDLSIYSNKFLSKGVGGTVRQPVTFEGVDSNPHTYVSFRFNIAIGTFTAYNDPTTPGTADLFSFHRVRDFVVEGNFAIGSGDVGITIAVQCSRGTVNGNVVIGSNSCGIAIGSGTLTTYVRGLSIKGNTLMNNGVNAVGDRSTTKSGVWFNNASDCVLGENVLGDDQVTKTQSYGYILQNCTNIIFGTDVNAGLGTGFFNVLTGVTNCYKPATQQLVS